MKVVNGSTNLSGVRKYPVITFGNFDGVHRGHQKIISKVLQLAGKHNGTGILYTFNPHPVKVLSPDLTPPLLQTTKQKREVLEALGLDLMIIEPFTRKLANLTAERYFKEIIVERLCAKEIVIGYDFTFGLHREGKVEDLEKFAAGSDIKVHVVNALFHKDSLLSSTHIRHFVEIGDLASATAMLGRPYAIEGKVIKGRGVGAEVGFHTANLTSENELIPPPGVYITSTKLMNTQKQHMSLTNIGYNPTFGGTNLSIETYLLDFTGNLLNHNIEVEFHKKIRREMTFESTGELRGQIEKDVVKARKFYEKRI
jgi:riboflavin kinase/FMN adenylyltransferase